MYVEGLPGHRVMNDVEELGCLEDLSLALLVSKTTRWSKLLKPHELYCRATSSYQPQLSRGPLWFQFEGLVRKAVDRIFLDQIVKGKRW